MIALSHPLTINGRPGFRRRPSGRKEGGFEGSKQRREGAQLSRKTTTVSPCFFPHEVVKGPRRGLLKATTSSSLDVGSEASLAVGSAQRRCMFCGGKDRERWARGDVVVGLEMLCVFTDPGR